MRTLSLLIVILFLISCKSNNKPNPPRGIPAILSIKGNLIFKIKPNKLYSYWEYITVIAKKRESAEMGYVYKKYRIFARGNKKWGKIFLNQIAKTGFNNDHQPNGYSYIAYIDQGNIYYITSLEKLKPFIGKIDNIEEAILTAQRNGFQPILDTKTSSYYQFVDGKFELNHMKINGFKSNEFNQKVIIDRNGNCTIIKMKAVN